MRLAMRAVALTLIIVTAHSALLPTAVGAANVTANVFSDPSPGACATTGTGNCSLREAVLFANANPGATISLLAGTYSLSSGGLLLKANTTIVGQGAGITTIDAGGSSNILTVYFSTAVSITGVTIRGGRSNGLGGAILNDSSLTLTNDDITANLSTAFPGGAIYRRVHSHSTTRR